MGACCDHFFQKEEIHTNESRLRLLEHKVTPAYHTDNDPHFTYFLRLFEQHAYLQRLLRNYKHPEEQTEDSSELSLASDRIAQEHKYLEQYMRQYEDKASPLSIKMAEDQRKIAAQVGEKEEGCMVKLEIQSLEVIKGISRIKVVQEYSTESGIRTKEEFLIINRVRAQKIYREFIFPTATKSKLRLTTDSIPSAMTIDVEDISKAEVICDVFNFKAKNEDFGFIALRLQFFSFNEAYRKQKHQRLIILEKELKLCQMGKDGMQRLSEYQSDTSSLRNTFLSEPVSEYPNQYEA